MVRQEKLTPILGLKSNVELGIVKRIDFKEKVKQLRTEIQD